MYQKYALNSTLMKISRVVLTGQMRHNDTIPVEQIYSAFEDENTQEVQFIIAGKGMYDPDACLSLIEIIENCHRDFSKKITSNMLTSIGILDFYVWLKSGIHGRSMRSTAIVWLKIPEWSRFSSKYDPEESLRDPRQNLEFLGILESINEYIPLAEYEDKRLSIMNIDEYGLLDESYLALMEKRNYGIAD